MVFPSVVELFENSPEVFMYASELLMGFADRILRCPGDAGCRSIEVAGEGVTHLLTVKGAIDCLFTMGFEEAGEFFKFPDGKDLKNLRATRNEIYQERNKYLRTKLSTDTEMFVNTYAHHGTENPIPGFVDKKQYSPNVKEQEKDFYLKLMSGYRKSLYYEDCALQERARRCVLVGELTRLAEAAFDLSKKSGGNKTVKLDVRDHVLMELTNWFKNNFFNWVDQPRCEFCGGASAGNDENLVPTDAERMWDANRVESYVCKSCGKHIRFPRYNHPLKLLETRRGRCGEWANCFTLLCRSLEFEARFAEDWTDHVWTEVFSVSQQRWIHVDPCEATFDQPLTYEAGWGKKLSYVIAYGHEEIVDVTWRYSSKHREVLARRRLCREHWLLQILKKMNNVCQTSLSPARKAVLSERKAVETVEFLCPKLPNTDDQKGRSSGSLAWRLQRGETNGTVDFQPYVFELTPNEIDGKRFHLQYSSAEDSYVRESNSSSSMKKWESGVYSRDNVARKIEHDWKMAYLARQEGSESASIVWKFNFAASNMKVKRVKILCEATVFESGKVFLTLCNDETCSPVPTGEGTFETSDFMGASVLMLKAELSLGKGDCAWQHAQLFRQSLTVKNTYSLDILVTFL